MTRWDKASQLLPSVVTRLQVCPIYFLFAIFCVRFFSLLCSLLFTALFFVDAARRARGERQPGFARAERGEAGRRNRATAQGRRSHPQKGVLSFFLMQFFSCFTLVVFCVVGREFHCERQDDGQQRGHAGGALRRAGQENGRKEAITYILMRLSSLSLLFSTSFLNVDTRVFFFLCKEHTFWFSSDSCFPFRDSATEKFTLNSRHYERQLEIRTCFSPDAAGRRSNRFLAASQRWAG